jgi:hypothetical protein
MQSASVPPLCALLAAASSSPSAAVHWRWQSLPKGAERSLHGAIAASVAFARSEQRRIAQLIQRRFPNVRIQTASTSDQQRSANDDPNSDMALMSSDEVALAISSLFGQPASDDQLSAILNAYGEPRPDTDPTGANVPAHASSSLPARVMRVRAFHDAMVPRLLAVDLSEYIYKLYCSLQPDRSQSDTTQIDGGLLTELSLAAALRAAGLPHLASRAALIREMFAEADWDSDGYVGLREFQRIVLAQCENIIRQNALENGAHQQHADDTADTAAPSATPPIRQPAPQRP